MNSLFAASIFAGLVAATPVMAQTNTGPSTPQVTPVPGSTGTEPVNPANPTGTAKPSHDNKSGATELQQGASGSSSGANGTSGPYNPTPSPGTAPAPQ